MLQGSKINPQFCTATQKRRTHISMEVSDPSHDDLMASNVLALLSSSELNSAPFPFLKSEEFSSSETFPAKFPLRKSDLLNQSNNGSRSSSASMESFKRSVKGEPFSGASHESSDLDDDGLQGNRMKPLSSLQSNCVDHRRLPMPKFSKRRSPSLQSNRTPAKVLAAARAGHRARRKAMHYCDNKENKETNVVTQTREVKGQGPKKRKSSESEGYARLLALRRRRSTLSSWKMTSLHENMSSLKDINAPSSISDCNGVPSVAKKLEPLTHKEKCPLLEVANDTEHVQKDNGWLKQSEISQQPKSVATEGLNLAAHQGSCFPPLSSQDQSSCLSSVNHVGKGMQPDCSLTKGENLMGISCTKPPAYPKTKFNNLTVLSRCSGHLVVNGGSKKEADAVEFDDQGIMCTKQAPCLLSTKRQDGHTKTEEDSVCFVRRVEVCNKDIEGEMGHASCLVPHIPVSSAISKSSMLRMDNMCNQSDLPQGLYGHSSLLLTSSIKSGSTYQMDKVLMLAEPQHFVDAPTNYNSNTAVQLTAVKQEYIGQNSVEAGLSCHPSPLVKVDVNGSGESKSGSQKALESSNQVVSQKSRCHPIAPRGATCYQHSQQSGVCLPRVRRGRPPRSKSNLCPCPEAKENTNKFARICRPSGILGKLNPGIITRLRDRKQVHAVLEAVIRGAFMTGMKENLRLQGVEEFDGLDAGRDHVVSAARWKEGTMTNTREREAINSTSGGQSTMKFGLVDECTKAALAPTCDRERQGHAVIEAGSDPMSEHRRVALRPDGVPKQEPCLLEPIEHMGCPLPTSEQCSRDATVDSLEVSGVDQHQNCSVEAENDQKPIANTFPIATGNVASCWLELLRLDIKGRLSALKRSKRRVSGVIVSGQLNDTQGKVATQADEMQKWRAFFLHMEHALCSEGTRLESWLNQITQMQASYCHSKGSNQGYMPSICGIGVENVGMDGANR